MDRPIAVDIDTDDLVLEGEAFLFSQSLTEHLEMSTFRRCPP